MTSTGKIAIVVLTYDRVHLLQQCVENVLARASDRTMEILIWNNGSTDETANYLSSLESPKIRAVNHDTNLGLNAYDLAIQSTTADYIVALDHDVIDAPANWDGALLDAYLKLPQMGFLATNLVDNPHDITSQIMYRDNAQLYKIDERNGVRLKVAGPVGGWCAMTSRDVYTSVGGVGRKKMKYWHWDEAYLKKLQAAGYDWAILDDVAVTHAGGDYYSPFFPEKSEFYDARERRAARRTRVKRLLLQVPFVRSLNERHHWFEPPS